MFAYVVWWGSLTITELLWCIVGTVGFVVSTWNLIIVCGDYAFLNHRKLNGQLRSIAISNIEQEILSCVVQAGVITVGVVAAIQPSFDPGQPLPTIAIVIIAALFTISVSTTIKSIRRNYWRRKIIGLGRRAEPEPNQKSG